MISEALASTRYSMVLKMLDEERQLLLSGPLDKLEALVKRREAAMTELLGSGVSLPEAFIMALKARAERNGRLIRASMEGVRSAQTHMQRINEQADRLMTYRADGSQVDVNATPKATRDTRA